MTSSQSGMTAKKPELSVEEIAAQTLVRQDPETGVLSLTGP